jgi:hypothetical protein
MQTRHCDASPHALNNPRLMRCTTFPNSTPHLNVSRLRRFTCDHRTLKHTCMAFLFSMFSLPCIVHPDCEISRFIKWPNYLEFRALSPSIAHFTKYTLMCSSELAGCRFLIRAIDVFLLLPVETGCGAHSAHCWMGTRGYFAGVKRPGREDDHSTPFNGEVKSKHVCISYPSYVCPHGTCRETNLPWPFFGHTLNCKLKMYVWYKQETEAVRRIFITLVSLWNVEIIMK